MESWQKESQVNEYRGMECECSNVYIESDMAFLLFSFLSFPFEVESGRRVYYCHTHLGLHLKCLVHFALFTWD